MFRRRKQLQVGVVDDVRTHQDAARSRRRSSIQKEQTAAADAASARAADERYRSAANGSRVEDVAVARAQLASAEGKLLEAQASVDFSRIVRARPTPARSSR